MFKPVLALATLVTALALIVPVVALADPPSGTVTTVPFWNGSEALATYGTNSTPTYGETITGTGQMLQSFTFYVNAPAEDLAVRGGLGVWDGSKITSVLWLGSTFDTVVVGPNFEALTFTPNVPLANGQQYVIFGTSLFDGLGGGGIWGFMFSGNTYPSGGAVWTNSTGDPMTVLTSGWDGINWIPDGDLAFSLELADNAKPANRSAYCSVAGNTDGGSGATLPVGTFLDLAAGQPESDSNYTGATAAFYYEGVGASCDHLSGFHPTGTLVGYGGAGDPGSYVYMAKN